MALPRDEYIFTTLRLDPRLTIEPANTAASSGKPSSIYLQCYHFNRLSEAAAANSAGNAAQWLSQVPNANDLERQVLDALGPVGSPESLEMTGARRVKVCLYRDGGVAIECPQAAAGQPLLFPQTFQYEGKPSWTAVVDAQATIPDVCTSFKTSDREAYDRARAFGATPTQEVLLYNNLGEVMDASITTPYFLRNGQWVTPSAAAGGQRGATRQWALGRELCIEATVKKSELRNGEMIWLSNALRGFFPATLKLGA